MAGNGKLPNATATLVLGILSIVGCLFWGLPGLICGIIAIALYSKDKKLYKTDPNHYAMSFKNSQAGFICGIIGTILSSLLVLYFIFFIVLFAGLAR
ncbi:MAG TPA: DUF4190 domain-containing protein [Crocinitomicaceae bacterium]|nr:DUF4190 domain-containing protein [Crocinitomicaceae bacterium]